MGYVRGVVLIVSASSILLSRGLYLMSYGAVTELYEPVRLEGEQTSDSLWVNRIPE